MFKKIIEKIRGAPPNTEPTDGAIGGAINGEQKEEIEQKDTEYDTETIFNWSPHMELSSVEIADNPNGYEILSAAREKKQIHDGWTPTFFINPHQDIDYMLIEAGLKRTPGGSIMESFTKFVMGTGFRPGIELINPDKDDAKNAKELEKYQYIVDAMKEIDRQISAPADGLRDVSFFEKVTAMVNTAYSFNRSALIFSYDRPVKVNGKVYPAIPSGMKFAHPRDLGIIEVEPKSWKLKAVQWRMASEMVSVDDMIYLWNPLMTSKHHNGWFYGGSMVLSMLDAMKTLMRIVGVDFPAMAQATWTGMFFLIVKPHGQTKSKKIEEYKDLVNNITKGGPNLVIEDPENVDFKTASYEPRVREFIELCQFLLKWCVAQTGLPHALLFDEASVNRATLIGKIQLAKSIAIDPVRSQISEQITTYWYDRWARLIFPKEMEKVKMTLVFEDLHVEEWFDKVGAVSELSKLLGSQQQKLTIDALGELVGIDDLAGKVDEIKQEMMPGMGQMPGGGKPPGGAKMPGMGQMPGTNKTPGHGLDKMPGGGHNTLGKKHDKPVGLE